MAEIKLDECRFCGGNVGKKIDKEGIDDLGIMGVSNLPKKYKTGGIIGSVEIVDCVEESKAV